MDRKEFANLGDKIKNTVQSAIDSSDFNQLNHTISETVNTALDEAREKLVRGTGFDKKASEPGYQAFKRHPSEEREELKMNSVGRVSSILLTVFGGLGLFLTVVLFMLSLFITLIVNPAAGAVIGTMVFLLAMGGVSSALISIGISTRKRLKRAALYMKQSRNQSFIKLETLANAVGKTKEFVEKDVVKMMKLGIFKRIYMDEQKTCLIFREATYQQYLDSQKARIEREKEKKNEDSEHENPELKAMIAQGQTYLKVIKEANDAIPGEVISRKIKRLEDLISRIFESVIKNPKQMSEMERFMDYYLPTTAKLVQTYRDFDSTQTKGTNIDSAKKEIEGTLDTINLAFERLLDGLYQDAAWDITADASVLQTMLKKDGWADSDFTGGTKHE
ncbi:5-bromo-4-chloroindolyl phosphate hydrolysis family protein [Clostridium sp. E02]|uniref:5-bromo-4-chloroindolyl phosphate hydrolysis family protein n=1 Tax=Clostridium sp. E02 TaxID=2487134 RepID=UPI000F548919|nr:5-bromo-4-chloroindolyl phosphate hydrolysis family protein [Clostridium sp. E02]